MESQSPPGAHSTQSASDSGAPAPSGTEPDASPSIDVQLNGRSRSVPAHLTVKGLLEHLDLQPELVVVEHNLRILDRSTYASVPVAAGDRLELVHFVGGG